MNAIARHSRLAALLLAAGTLAACNGSLTVSLTDTPVDNATSVLIDFTGMELHNTNGSLVTINFPSPRQIDLLQLQNGVTAALAQGESVPAGNYDWMQLEVLATQDTQGQSYIALDSGAQYPLYIPSGAETGLRLTSPFTVSQSGTTRLIIEFNLRQSITTSDGQNYALVPAMRLENQDQVGTLTATIDLAALASQQLGSAAQASQCQGGLFVFSGTAVKPQNGGGASLVDFQPMPAGGVTGPLSVSLPYLAKGSYTVAATCDYNLYDPTATPGQSGYQTLHWTVLNDVAITSDQTTTETLPSGTSSAIVN